MPDVILAEVGRLLDYLIACGKGAIQHRLAALKFSVSTPTARCISQVSSLVKGLSTVAHGFRGGVSRSTLGSTLSWYRWMLDDLDSDGLGGEGANSQDHKVVDLS